MFESEVDNCDDTLVNTNIVSDTGALTNYVNTSFAESLGREIQDVNAYTGIGAVSG